MDLKHLGHMDLTMFAQLLCACGDKCVRLWRMYLPDSCAPVRVYVAALRGPDRIQLPDSCAPVGYVCPPHVDKFARLLCSCGDICVRLSCSCMDMFSSYAPVRICVFASRGPVRVYFPDSYVPVGYE